jgi:hypothetical protein
MTQHTGQAGPRSSLESTEHSNATKAGPEEAAADCEQDAGLMYVKP